MIDCSDIHRVLDISVKMAFHKLEDSYLEISDRATQHGLRKFYIKEYPLVYRDKISLYRNVSIISLFYAKDFPKRIEEPTDYEEHIANLGIVRFIKWLNTDWSKVVFNKIFKMLDHNISLYNQIMDDIRKSNLPCAVNYANILDTLFNLNHIR